MAKFSWANYPDSDTEFEHLMIAIDTLLAAEGLKLFQRPLHVGKKFGEAFGWSGSVVPPVEYAELSGFHGEILMAKALRWYEDILGKRLETYLELGHVPALIGRTIWRVRVSNWFGKVVFFADRNLKNKSYNKIPGNKSPSLNVLTLVENLPQGMVDRLSEKEIIAHFNFHIFCVENMQWRSNLPKTKLLSVAGDDYNCSTQELIENRYAQSRWASQQCVEKTLKGILELGGSEYPKGSKGHDLENLAIILNEEHGVKIDNHLIKTAHCSTGARYNEEKSCESQALHANIAALGIYDILRKSEKIENIITTSINKN